MIDSHLTRLIIALIIRTALIALYLIIGLRVAGKRQLGQMNIYDLALIMLVANAVQNAMTEGSGYLGAGFASAGTLLFIGAALSYLFVKLPRFEQRIVGMPTVIISDGKINEEALRRENIEDSILKLALRQHELDDVEQVKLAVLEPDGSISVVAYPDAVDPEEEEEAAPPAPGTESRDERAE